MEKRGADMPRNLLYEKKMAQMSLKMWNIPENTRTLKNERREDKYVH